MGRSKRGGLGKKPPSSPSVTFIDGIPIESNVVPCPSVTLVIDGFPIRAMPHLAADAEVGSPNALPDPERHEYSEDPIRTMPHLAADAEVGSPDKPPDLECHKDSEEARGSSLSPSLLRYKTDPPIENEEVYKYSVEARGSSLSPSLLQYNTGCVIFLDTPFFRLFLPEKKTNGHIFLVRFLCPHNAILPDFDTRMNYEKQLMSNKKN
jgi:hypothetical protein